MISSVIFNDQPTMHQIMNAAGNSTMTVIRRHVDDESVIPTDSQIMQILDLHHLDDEYMSYVSIYYDIGNNVSQFQRFVLNRIKTIYNIT